MSSDKKTVQIEENNLIEKLFSNVKNVSICRWFTGFRPMYSPLHCSRSIHTSHCSCVRYYEYVTNHFLAASHQLVQLALKNVYVYVWAYEVPIFCDAPHLTSYLCSGSHWSLNFDLHSTIMALHLDQRDMILHRSAVLPNIYWINQHN